MDDADTNQKPFDIESFLESLREETGTSAEFLQRAKTLIEGSIADIDPKRRAELVKALRATFVRQAALEETMREAKEAVVEIQNFVDRHVGPVIDPDIVN